MRRPVDGGSLLFLILALLFPFACASLRLTLPNGAETAYELTYNIYFNQPMLQEFNRSVTGALAEAREPSTTSPTSNLSTPLILLYRLPIAGMSEELLPMWAEMTHFGVTALIFGVESGLSRCGREMYQIRHNVATGIDVPVFCMLHEPFEELLREAQTAANSSLIATIDPQGTSNGWFECYEHPVTTVLFSILATYLLATMVFGIVKLVQVQKFDRSLRKRTRNYLGPISIGVNIFGLLMSFIYFAVDPTQIRRIYSDVTQSILITFPFPFFFSADLLVILFWIKLLSTKNLSNLDSMRRIFKPFICIASYLCFAEIVLSSVRVYISSSALRLVSTLNAAVGLCLVIITIIIVLIRIQQTNKDTMKIKANGWMLSMAVLGVLSLIFTSLISVPSLAQTPWAYVITLWIGMVFMVSIQITQIGMFRSRKHSDDISVNAETSSSLSIIGSSNLDCSQNSNDSKGKTEHQIKEGTSHKEKGEAEERQDDASASSSIGELSGDRNENEFQNGSSEKDTASSEPAQKSEKEKGSESSSGSISKPRDMDFITPPS